MEGWQSSHRQAPDGAIESQQRVDLARPVVEFSTAGAERLGHSYWREVRRLTGSLVLARERGGTLELRLLGGAVLLRFGRPTIEGRQTPAFFSFPIAGGLPSPPAARGLSLLRLDRPTIEASETRAFCSYPIAGGLLSRRAAGELSFEQTGGALTSTVRGFFPRVAHYDRLQGRAHVAISRRYFRRLIAEAAR